MTSTGERIIIAIMVPVWLVVVAVFAVWWMARMEAPAAQERGCDLNGNA